MTGSGSSAELAEDRVSNGKRFHATQCGLFFLLQKPERGLGDLHTNEGACFGMRCSFYQIKTTETEWREDPCLEYPVSLSLCQKVGGRLWVTANDSP